MANAGEREMPPNSKNASLTGGGAKTRDEGKKQASPCAEHA